MVWAPGAPVRPYRPGISDASKRVLFVLTSIVIWVVMIQFGLIVPVLVLFALPALTILNVTNRMRATAEHVVTPRHGRTGTQRGR